MKKIPEQEIERIKRQADLVAEASKRGIELKKKGKEYVGLCPFHSEKTPSFHVNPDKNEWHCFGCDYGGDVIEFIMKYDKKDFRTVLQDLDGSPQTQTIKKSSAPKNTSSPIEPSSQNEASDTLIFDAVLYYCKILSQTPSALAYLQGRGLNHPELIKTFRIGYCDRTLGKLFPAEKRKGDGSPADPSFRSRLKQGGILRSDGKEHFVGCLTFPVFKVGGTLGEIYGRRTSKPRVNLSPHLYLPGAHQGVFNLKTIGHDSPLILCESIIDALSFWVHGWRHVTASFGVNGFTDEMSEAIQSKGVKSLWIAYDNDDPGNQAADVLAPRLAKVGIHVERVLLPQGSDVNQMMCQAGNPQETLKNLLNQRQGYGFTNPKNPCSNWDGQQLNLTFGNRHYRIRGIDKIQNISTLKVQIKVNQADLVFLDTVDLTLYRQRLTFINGAGEELNLEKEVIKRDLGKVLLEVERKVEERLTDDNEKQEKPKVMTPGEMEEALNFLKQKDLLDQVLEDFKTIGLVGEESNKLVSYLVALSRKLSDPLAALIQSSSSAGKTILMDSVLSLVPPEDQEKWTTMTGQALYYIEEDLLKHKLLAVAEEEGVEKATYPLKILQSEKQLTIATTVKDPKSGEFKVQNKTVQGPCAIILTTTSADVDEELINRFIRLTVNEDKEQTQAIHQAQRQSDTLEGLKQRAHQERIKIKHHNAQRLLQSIRVINPYSEQLTFISDYLRNRRDHKKYLGLIKVITFLHQYQRAHKQTQINGTDGHPELLDYIEVTPQDIEIANGLMTEVLGRCLDELAPQTRRLLELIHKMVNQISESKSLEFKEIRFTRRQVREDTHWSDSQLKTHMKRLEELEYLTPHQGGRGLTFVYELLWFGEGSENNKFYPGLIDPKNLKN